MTLCVWLVVWLLNDTPDVRFSPLNAWAVALVVCALIDLTERAS